MNGIAIAALIRTFTTDMTVAREMWEILKTQSIDVGWEEAWAQGQSAYAQVKLFGSGSGRNLEENLG